MSDNRFDVRTRICSSKHKTYLPNIAMHNIRALLLKLIRIDRQLINISMLYINLCGITKIRIIKIAVSIYTFISVFEKCMAYNSIRICVVMIPYKRNLLTIIMLKSISANDSAVRTLKIVLSSPSTKIIVFHFDI